MDPPLHVSQFFREMSHRLDIFFFLFLEAALNSGLLHSAATTPFLVARCLDALGQDERRKKCGASGESESGVTLLLFCTA
jgi:hypothetical protein